MFSKLSMVALAASIFIMGSSAYAGGIANPGESRDTLVICRGDIGDLYFWFPGPDYRGEHLDLLKMKQADLRLKDRQILQNLVQNQIIGTQNWDRRALLRGQGIDPRNFVDHLFMQFYQHSPGLGLADVVAGGTLDILYRSLYTLHPRLTELERVDVRSTFRRMASQYSLQQITPNIYQIEISEITSPTKECVASELIPNPWDPHNPNHPFIEQCTRYEDRDPQTQRVVFTEKLKIHTCQKFRQL